MSFSLSGHDANVGTRWQGALHDLRFHDDHDRADFHFCLSSQGNPLLTSTSSLRQDLASCLGGEKAAEHSAPELRSRKEIRLSVVGDINPVTLQGGRWRAHQPGRLGTAKGSHKSHAVTNNAQLSEWKAGCSVLGWVLSSLKTTLSPGPVPVLGAFWKGSLEMWSRLGCASSNTMGALQGWGTGRHTKAAGETRKTRDMMSPGASRESTALPAPDLRFPASKRNQLNSGFHLFVSCTADWA